MLIVHISLYDHSNIRSDFTEHTIKNNKYLTPGCGGQFIPDKGGQVLPAKGGQYARFFQSDF